MTTVEEGVIVVGIVTGRRRVLLVDDDPLARLAVDRQLDVLGYDVISVNNGEEAIRVMEMGFPFELLLIDLRLPDLDGRAVAYAAMALVPAVRIVFMSGFVPGQRLNAPFLLKPFSTLALAWTLDVARYGVRN
ncbi:MAG: response regulator [Vicinamibacterales bacterium]